VRRHDAGDPTAWLRGIDYSIYGNKPRIVIAHGSTQGFLPQDSGDDDGPDGGVNQIALDRLPLADLDYIALGDWHGMKEAGPKAWYSGTPELDRFPKGGDHSPGYALAVTVGRGAAPVVEPVRTARFGWHGIDHQFTDDAVLTQLEEKMAGAIRDRVDEDLVRMELTGSLSIAHFTHLDALLEKWRARLLRLKLYNQVRVAPSPEEIAALTSRASDPLVSRVAARLIEQMGAGGEEAEVARIALRELHAKIS
jgi:DNA repair exonuclease SbcCD nuclease subunit